MSRSVLSAVPMVVLLLVGMAGCSDPTVSEIKAQGGRVHIEGDSVVDVNFYHAEVTDAGLEHLKQLPGLRVLILSDTLVTPEGVEELRQTLPIRRIDH